MDSYVELFNLGKSYATSGGSLAVVRGFNLRIARGEVVALIGHSGCGKSTVLTMVAGLTETSEGSVGVGNREISGPGPDRSVVFQSPCLLPWMSAYDNVMLGVEQVFRNSTAEQRRQIVLYYLSQVGLADAAHKMPRELSQGMQQRVGVARACALAPRVLLLDEPFGMLDSLTRMDLQDVLLAILERDGTTALMVTHDVDEALYVADRVVMMTSGPAAHVGDVLTTPFARPRVRPDVLEHPAYYELRERLIGFLEDQQRGSDALERSGTCKRPPDAVPTEEGRFGAEFLAGPQAS
jgi:nitrate/nitrite transport system ATP-binding protein